jgi:hypothetical protein
MIYIAISKFGWGKDPVARKAILKCLSQTPRGFRAKPSLRLYEAHDDTTIYSDGSWDFPGDEQPREIPLPTTQQSKN